MHIFGYIKQGMHNPDDDDNTKSYKCVHGGDG